jgi:predicted nucleic acid-binding protein
LIFIDSNVWCYYFDQRLPEHLKIREPMRQIIKSEEILSNTIVAMEVAHYLVRHFPKETARKKIDFFVNLKNFRIVDFNAEIMAETIETLLEHAYADGLGGRDATIIATMKAQNTKKIISHDSIFRRLENKIGLELVDPI